MLQQLFTMREGRLLAQLLAAMKPASNGQQVGGQLVGWVWVLMTWLGGVCIVQRDRRKRVAGLERWQQVVGSCGFIGYLGGMLWEPCMSVA